ncbi:hypothetical protein KA005_84725, partial [bacterium]|nr:hypothetical protein [bacterium]
MNSKAIRILGMHRSGTSAITRAVNLLGVYLGEGKDIMAAGSDNPAGFWERNDIVELHDRILKPFKKSWGTALPLPDNWHLSKEMMPFRNELFELVKKDFGDKTIWAWKDPRTSILLDIWKDVLNELDIELNCVLVTRNPLDSAKSLEKRNGFSYDKSFGIWLNYNLTALQATND